MKGRPMSSNLDSIELERSPLDVGLGEVLHIALASLWRRKLLVGTIVATALALGVVALFLIPSSYTPVAYIRGGFVVSNAVAKDEDSKSGPFVGIDLTRMIETQSRVLQSQELARRVVQQLGLERLQTELSERHWLPDELYLSAAKTGEGQTDQDETGRAAIRLLSRLSVTSDQLRTYMIKVSYTDNDPKLAVVVTNAFVSEFLRSSKLQMLAQQRSSAEAALTKELARFGDKHPRVMQAKMRLAATDDLSKTQLSESPQVLLEAAGENLTEATAATSTKSPNPPLVIGLLVFIGLVVGITVALWLERNRWVETFSRYVRPFA
jgi:uncharacterized protein involved in exopolysaccharide biosynthesis